MPYRAPRASSCASTPDIDRQSMACRLRIRASNSEQIEPVRTRGSR
ncbi:hypothetical protein C7S17_3375 [Burkholderia thailandensis]|nr:hypothetical protein [Burkholderia thailandensis]